MSSKVTVALTGVLAAIAAYCVYRGYRAYGSPRIQLGTLGEWLAALVTFIAVAAALYIAWRDRRDRRDERDAADEAQAALVIVQPFVIKGNPGIGVLVHNYGTFSILRVTAARVEIEGYPPDLIPHREEGGANSTPRIAPRRDSDQDDGHIFMFRAEPDERHAAYRRALEDIVDSGARLNATVWFRDANGNRWETVFRAPAMEPREEDDRRIIETYHLSPSPKRL